MHKLNPVTFIPGNIVIGENLNLASLEFRGGSKCIILLYVTHWVAAFSPWQVNHVALDSQWK
jgi:hypothetical protein